MKDNSGGSRLGRVSERVNDANIMNGWREGGGEGGREKKVLCREKQSEATSRRLQFKAISYHREAHQFPKHELSGQSIKQAVRRCTRCSSSTQQRQRGDLWGMTNPHELQEQHPFRESGALCILVRQLPNTKTPTLPEAASSPPFTSTREGGGKVSSF